VKIRLFSLSFRRRSIIVGKTSKDKNLRRRIEKKRKDPKRCSFEDDDTQTPKQSAFDEKIN